MSPPRVPHLPRFFNPSHKSPVSLILQKAFIFADTSQIQNLKSLLLDTNGSIPQTLFGTLLGQPSISWRSVHSHRASASLSPQLCRISSRVCSINCTDDGRTSASSYIFALLIKLVRRALYTCGQEYLCGNVPVQRVFGLVICNSALRWSYPDGYSCRRRSLPSTVGEKRVGFLPL